MENNKSKANRKYLVKNNEGITLITLVVIILIIIILSGVTIYTALGDNGLIYQARNAKELAENSMSETEKKMDEVYQEYKNILHKEELNNIKITYSSLENGNVLGTLEETIYNGSGKAKAEIRVEPNEGFAFDYFTDDSGNKYWNVEQLRNTTFFDSTNIVAHFSNDELGKEILDGNGIYYSDGIPDKYQAKVSFDVSGGTASFRDTMVTLYDENNNWSEEGIGYLKSSDIPVCTPNSGYDKSTEEWDPPDPTSVPIYGGFTISITYSAPTVVPPEPDLPSPTATSK